MKLTTNLHLIQDSEWMALYIHSPYAFMKLSLIKHSDNCTFYYTIIWHILNHVNISQEKIILKILIIQLFCSLSTGP